MALLSGMSMIAFFSFWATNARRMSTAVTGASGTDAAGPALGADTATGAEAAAGVPEDAAGPSEEPPAAGSGSSSTGSTS